MSLRTLTLCYQKPHAQGTFMQQESATCTLHTNTALTTVPPPRLNFPSFCEVHSLTSTTPKLFTLSSPSQLAVPSAARSPQLAMGRLYSMTPKCHTILLSLLNSQPFLNCTCFQEELKKGSKHSHTTDHSANLTKAVPLHPFCNYTLMRAG